MKMLFAYIPALPYSQVGLVTCRISENKSLEPNADKLIELEGQVHNFDTLHE